MKEIFNYFVISMISSAALIVMSKIILDRLIRRDKDYYESDELGTEKKLLAKAGLLGDGKDSED